MRCTEEPLGKWYRYAARLDSLERHTHGMAIVIVVFRAVKKRQLPQLRHLKVIENNETMEITRVLYR